MERSDLRNAYESYRLGTIYGEIYQEQRKAYEQLLVRMAEKNEKQQAAGSKMVTLGLSEVAGIKMLEGQMKLQKLTRESWMLS